MYKKVILRKGKEIPILHKHHWIFSGAIQKHNNPQNGEIVEVVNFQNRFLGYGFYNSKTQIAVRMITHDRTPVLEALKTKIISAAKLRAKLFDDSKTNAYRLINSEGDSISGLTVDKYNKALVIQISSLGLELIKPDIVEILREVMNLDIIYEKSTMPARAHEGLKNCEEFLFVKSGTNTDQKIEIKENDVKFLIDLQNSHKTGFYLDQREMRRLVGELSKSRKLLNCFSYTGGFSLYAALNSAISVTSLDISQEVIDQAKENFTANNLDPSKYKFLAADVFEFLKKQERLEYDFVILDPPAFAKKKADYERALNGYGQINRLAMKKMPKSSFLLTCSCSYHVDEESFKKVLLKAANEAERKVRILSSHIMAQDHALNIFHPELNYLKSFLLYIE